jgi:hypothetical protein
MEALSALAYPGVPWHLDFLGSELLPRNPVPANEALVILEAASPRITQVDVSLGVQTRPEAGFYCYANCYKARPDCWDVRYGPLWFRVAETLGIYPPQMDIALHGGKRAEEVEAAVAFIQAQEDTESVLLRLCAPGQSKRVVTGCLTPGKWWPPVEVAATYHVDGKVARDLALSWIYIHDGDCIGGIAGLSLEELTARVAAAPPGTQVGVAEKCKHVFAHVRRDSAALKMRATRPIHLGAIRHGPRDLLPTDVLLSREQVLSALATPKEALLEALDAAAVPDDTWRSVEPQALEMIAAKSQGAPTYEVNVETRGHVHFIEQHAPYHIRRLPNGGVLLATHPYRTLWPLWQDALFLLGITP